MNDLISRQAVLDAIKKTHWFTIQADSNADYPCGTIDDIVSLNVHMDIDAVRRAINDVPAVSGWISVKDRLPVRPPDVCGLLVRRQWYLVALESGAVLTLSYEFDEDRWGGVGSPVTHWMPLPEAPKEENDAE